MLGPLEFWLDFARILPRGKNGGEGKKKTKGRREAVCSCLYITAPLNDLGSLGYLSRVIIPYLY